MEKASNVPLSRALDAVRGALTQPDAVHFVMLLALLRHEAQRDDLMETSQAEHAWSGVLGRGLWMRDGRDVVSEVMRGLGEWQAHHRELRDLPPDLTDVRGADLEPLVHCVSTAQDLATLFEDCLEHVQRSAKGGDYYTPMDLAGLVSGLMEPRPGESVYDPACGSGGFLLKADEYARTRGGQPGDTALYGQDSNRAALETAAINLTVHGVPSSLHGPASSLTEGGFQDLTFDVVLANPPFNQTAWSQQGREIHPDWRYGVPPAGNGNFAWAQHVVSRMSPKGPGRGALLLPTAAASTTRSAELQIRANLIENDALSCVIELPAGLLPHVRNPVTLWLFNSSKKGGMPWGASDRSGHTLLIDASDTAVKVARGRRILPDDARSRITATFASWRGAQDEEPYEDVPSWCRSLSIEEIAAQDYDVLPSRRVGAPVVEAGHGDDKERVGDLTQELYGLFDMSHRLEAELRDLLEQW
ncbi:N-6 DNA methylase [Streptomyces sp. SM11]|uniref:N-6 DNA methylase n=1 Tax=Streptomyces sp. SM11 TaxID=565557 RepID=UPI0015E1B739|nr:N-6 DNA methylase [Streptomyces sp. SM11]